MAFSTIHKKNGDHPWDRDPRRIKKEEAALYRSPDRCLLPRWLLSCLIVCVQVMRKM